MRCKFLQSRPQRGFTLLEVLVTIIVIAIAATAIMGVFTGTIRSSANPLIQQQAVAIAEAYMEEILLKQFCHDAPQPMTVLPPPFLPPCTGESGGAEEGARADFNDVQDYDGLTGPAADQNGNGITGLENYTVSVSVNAANFGTAILQGSGNAMRVDVTVSHAAIDDIQLSGFRANY